MRHTIVVLFVSLAIASANAAVQTLPPFTGIQVCTPFNVAIAPSADGKSYSYSVDGDASVAPAISGTVSNGVLSLQSTGGFTTQQPVKVVVSLPASQLEGVVVSSAAGILVLVESGFSVDSLVANLQGSADLVFLDVKANAVKLVNAGTGNLVFAGAANAAIVEATGTGATYVAGVETQVQVQGGGTSNILISSTSASLKITGQVSGIASLRYNQGVCSVSSSGLGRGCSKTTSVRPPAVQAQWSCGLQLSGTFGCATGGSTSSSSSGGNGNGFSSSSSSGGGSSSSFSSSSSSSSDGGFSFQSSSNDGGGSSSSSSLPGGGGTSTLTTNTGKLVTGGCAVSGTELNMVQ